MSHLEGDFQRYAKEYDPIKNGSIDGTDLRAHDRALLRALSSAYEPNKSVRGDPRRTVFVGRLHPKTTQETVHSEFSQCGKIVQCRLIKDIVTGKSKRYAFIEFQQNFEVERALAKHKDLIDNSEVIVEREVERLLKGWKPRRLGGGFGGTKEAGQLRFGCRERPFRKPINVAKEEGGKKDPAQRSIDHSSLSKHVHSVSVHVLPLKHCQTTSFQRHLVPLFPISHSRCGTAPLCAGILFSRGTPCNYCAGSPLVYKGYLFGVMSDNEACGSACEPALYVNVATVMDWIRSVLDGK